MRVRNSSRDLVHVTNSSKNQSRSTPITICTLINLKSIHSSLHFCALEVINLSILIAPFHFGINYVPPVIFRWITYCCTAYFLSFNFVQIYASVKHAEQRTSQKYRGFCTVYIPRTSSDNTVRVTRNQINPDELWHDGFNNHHSYWLISDARISFSSLAGCRVDFLLQGLNWALLL